jgi:hypothetical protein
VQRRRRDHGVEPRVGERERRGLSGSEGGFDDLRAAMLASHGYAALAVAYFGSRGPQEELLEVWVERIESAVEWVRGRAALDVGRISALGASKGAAKRDWQAGWRTSPIGTGLLGHLRSNAGEFAGSYGSRSGCLQGEGTRFAIPGIPECASE